MIKFDKKPEQLLLLTIDAGTGVILRKLHKRNIEMIQSLNDFPYLRAGYVFLKNTKHVKLSLWITDIIILDVFLEGKASVKWIYTNESGVTIQGKTKFKKLYKCLKEIYLTFEDKSIESL